MEPSEVEVWVGAEVGTPHTCPDCAAVSAIHHHVERRLRHLDTCMFRTVLCARVPRVRCATHGVRTTLVPWGRARVRQWTVIRTGQPDYSALLEAFLADVLSARTRGAARVLESGACMSVARLHVSSQ
jgi:transposase